MNSGEWWLGHAAQGSLEWGCFVVSCVSALFVLGKGGLLFLTLVSLHKVFNKCWWNGEVWYRWPLHSLPYARGTPTPPAPGAPLWCTPPSILRFLLHTPCKLNLQFRTKRQKVTSQLIMLWWFGVGCGQKEGLPHPQQTSTSRASGIRSRFGLLGTTLCFQPCWCWKRYACRGIEGAWNLRTRRITCLVERFFAFIPVPCCPLMPLA